MFKKFISLSLLVCLINLFSMPVFAKTVVLESGTKVRLKLVNSVSTNSCNEGDQVEFAVAEDVKLGDTVLIKQGTKAIGYISELTAKEMLGKGGKMTIYLDETRAIDGRKVPLSGLISRKGNDRIILTASLAILTAPIGLLFLLMKGKDAKLPANYQIQARVDNDVTVSLKDNFVPVTNVR